MDKISYNWWIVFLICAFLAPPIPLGFMGTNSTVSIALPIAGLYIVWRRLMLGHIIITPLTTFGFIAHAVTVFISFHCLYYLIIENNINVFFMEVQWIVFFSFSVSIIFDMSKSPNFQQRLTKSFLWVLFITGLIGILSSFTGPIYDYYVGYYSGRYGVNIYRAVGTLGGANIFAGIMAMALIITIFSPNNALPLKRRNLIIVFFVALLFSQSKSGLVSFVIACGSILVLQFLLQGSLKHFIRMSFFLIIGASASLYFLHTITDVYQDDMTFRSTATDNVISQFQNFEIGNKLFGVGFRQTAYTVRGAWVTAHNSYISFIAEIGIMGITLLLFMWLLSLKSNLKSKNWAWLGALIVMLAHFYTEGYIYSYLYVVFMCAIFVSGLLSDNQSFENSSNPSLTLIKNNTIRENL